MTVSSSPSCVRRWTPLAIAALALSGCKDVTPNAAGPNDVGGTMVTALTSEPGTVLPTLVVSAVDRQVTDLMYDRLAEIGPELNTIGDKGFRPQLAERWEWANDSLSIAFHLNPRARWHDGMPVRASDVRYSVKIAKDPALGSPMLPLITNVDSVSVRDSLTAVAWFKRRAPEQFYDLVYQVLIVPEHVLGNTPTAQLRTAEAARRGIGSGRFRLARWEPGQRMELIADTANYRGRPKLDRVVYAFNPDANSAATRFFAGDADLLEQLRPDQVAKLKGDTVRRAIKYPAFQYVYLMFNFVDPKQPTKPHPIFSERAVRRALSMAVDRRAMLRNVFDTLGQPLYGPFPRSISVADTTIPQLPYDTARARALLDSAGWTLGPDGVRSKNGRRLEFAISTPSSSAPRHQYAVLLQDALRRIGASVKIDETDAASVGAKLVSRGFDAMLFNYATDPSVSGLKQSWASSGISKDGSNYAAYSNPTVDAMLDSAIASFDPARTKSYSRHALETIIEDAPAVWLYEPVTIMGLAKRIHTTSMRADGYWSDLPAWWIPAAQRTPRDKIGLRATP